MRALYSLSLSLFFVVATFRTGTVETAEYSGNSQKWRECLQQNDTPQGLNTEKFRDCVLQSKASLGKIDPSDFTSSNSNESFSKAEEQILIELDPSGEKGCFNVLITNYSDKTIFDFRLGFVIYDHEGRYIEHGDTGFNQYKEPYIMRPKDVVRLVVKTEFNKPFERDFSLCKSGVGAVEFFPIRCAFQGERLGREACEQFIRMPQLRTVDFENSQVVDLSILSAKTTKDKFCEVNFIVDNRAGSPEVGLTYFWEAEDQSGVKAGGRDFGYLFLSPKSSQIATEIVPIACEEIGKLRVISEECHIYEPYAGYCPSGWRLRNRFLWRRFSEQSYADVNRDLLKIITEAVHAKLDQRFLLELSHGWFGYYVGRDGQLNPSYGSYSEAAVSDEIKKAIRDASPLSIPDYILRKWDREIRQSGQIRFPSDSRLIDWHRVTTLDSGHTVYAEDVSNRSFDDTTPYWIMLDSSVPIPTSQGWRSLSVLVQSDCPNRKSRVLDHMGFASSMARGESTISLRMLFQEWAHADDGPMWLQSAFAVKCGSKNSRS